MSRRVATCLARLFGIDLRADATGAAVFAGAGGGKRKAGIDQRLAHFEELLRKADTARDHVVEVDGRRPVEGARTCASAPISRGSQRQKMGARLRARWPMPREARRESPRARSRGGASSPKRQPDRRRCACLASGMAILPQPTFSWVCSFTFLKMVARKVMATSPRSSCPGGRALAVEAHRAPSVRRRAGHRCSSRPRRA